MLRCCLKFKELQLLCCNNAFETIYETNPHMIFVPSRSGPAKAKATVVHLVLAITQTISNSHLLQAGRLSISAAWYLV